MDVLCERVAERLRVHEEAVVLVGGLGHALRRPHCDGLAQRHVGSQNPQRRARYDRFLELPEADVDVHFTRSAHQVAPAFVLQHSHVRVHLGQPLESRDHSGQVGGGNRLHGNAHDGS